MLILNSHHSKNLTTFESKITGFGSYLPKKIVTNKDLEELLDTTNDWIVQRTGIKKRHWATSNESTTSLAEAASRQLLSRAELDPKEIDLVLFATVTPDHEFPGSACFLIEKLGISCPAIDVRQQCSGFIYALCLADQFVRSGSAKKILVVCSELHSKCLDLTPRGRDVSALFGDGAGAILVEAQEQISCSVDPNDSSIDLSSPGIKAISVDADGTLARDLWCPAPGTGLGTEKRIEPGMLAEGLQFPHMKGRSIFTSAIKVMGDNLISICKSVGLSIHELDKVFFHQANLRICEGIMKRLELDPSKVHNTISDFGNTTSATIPLGLADAYDNKKIKPGDKIATVAFGSGLAWGAAIFTL